MNKNSTREQNHNTQAVLNGVLRIYVIACKRQNRGVNANAPLASWCEVLVKVLADHPEQHCLARCPLLILVDHIEPHARIEMDDDEKVSEDLDDLQSYFDFVGGSHISDDPVKT